MEPWNSDNHTMSHLDRLEAVTVQQCPATLTMLSSPNIKTSLVNKLSFKNDNLQNKRRHLRKTVAELGIGNWNLLKESEDLKDEFRRLQANANCLNTSVEDLHREVDDAWDTLRNKDNKSKQLELQSKNLD